MLSPAPCASTPRPEPPIAAQRVFQVLRCDESPSVLASAINHSLKDRGNVSHVLSLDFHKVTDCSWASTCQLFTYLRTRPNALVLINSKCSTEQLIIQALSYIEQVAQATDYKSRSIPALFIRRPEKASKLWAAIEESELDSYTPVLHVDDKPLIVGQFRHWALCSWRGPLLRPGHRTELYDRVLPEIASWENR